MKKIARGLLDDGMDIFYTAAGANIMEINDYLKVAGVVSNPSVHFGSAST